MSTFSSSQVAGFHRSVNPGKIIMAVELEMVVVAEE